MANFDHFGYGLLTPVAAYALSALGCTLGFLIAKKARRVSGPGRVSLLAYSSIAIGVAGVWLPQVIALLGLSLPGGVVRYDVLALLTSLAVVVLNVGVGIFLVGFGRRKWWRVIVATPIIALGITATEFVAMSALRINGTITIDQMMLATRTAIAVVMAAAVLWCASRLKHLRASIIAGMATGAAFTLLHYLDMSGMTVHPSTTGPAAVGGLNQMVLLFPLVLVGTVTVVLVAYFSIGNSTMHELRSLYQPGKASLEPDLVREVTARIAGGAAVDSGQLRATAPETANSRETALPRAIRPRPTPGTLPMWRSMPTWGTTDADTEPATRPVTNTRDLRQRQRPAVASQVAQQWTFQTAATTTLPHTNPDPSAAPNAAHNGKNPAIDDQSRDTRRRNQRR